MEPKTLSEDQALDHLEAWLARLLCFDAEQRTLGVEMTRQRQLRLLLPVLQDGSGRMVEFVVGCVPNVVDLTAFKEQTLNRLERVMRTVVPLLDVVAEGPGPTLFRARQELADYLFGVCIAADPVGHWSESRFLAELVVSGLSVPTLLRGKAALADALYARQLLSAGLATAAEIDAADREGRRLLPAALVVSVPVN